MGDTLEEKVLLEKAALQYDLKALVEHIERRRSNIRIFEKAIEDEHTGIETDQKMIAFLELRHGTT